jgi:cell division protein ZapB
MLKIVTVCTLCGFATGLGARVYLQSGKRCYPWNPGLSPHDLRLATSTPGDLERSFTMSFEVFEKLEAKVQQAIDTITLLQMEIEELKEQNNNLNQQVQQAAGNSESVVRENQHLKEEQLVWQERLRALLGKMEEV